MTTSIATLVLCCGDVKCTDLEFRAIRTYGWFGGQPVGEADAIQILIVY